MTASQSQYELVTQTDAQTRRAGKSLGQLIQQPVVIGLYGDLGSGKTTWVKGLAEGVGGAGAIHRYQSVIYVSQRIPRAFKAISCGSLSPGRKPRF